MNIMSKLGLTVFEILNEIYIAVGAGVIGIGVLMNHGFRTNHFVRTLSVVSLSVGSLIYVFQSSEKKKPSKNKIIFITGCDSGLGFSFAQHASEVGFTVVAGHLSLESEGAKEIRRMHKTEIRQVEVDITKIDDVFSAVNAVEVLIETNPTYELYAVINNAGVMVFGEFEWLTERLIQQQIDVNLKGTFNITKAFIPLLRKSKGRLINIISHCSEACLPGLAVYGATKAGLAAFSDGLRVEQAKYGVKVINLIPGSFVTQSDIMAKHPDHVQEMHRGFSQEQHGFYEDYFQRYHAHLLGLALGKVPQRMENRKLYAVLEEALLNEQPKTLYKVEPIRYAFYHFLFKWSPVRLRDYFIVKFMQMPEYSLNQSW